MTLTAHNQDATLIRSAFARYPSGVVAQAPPPPAGPAANVAPTVAGGGGGAPPPGARSTRRW